MKSLDGIKVIDLTRHMSGPYATVMMSDYGADVIKIEALPAGDPSRQVGVAFIGGESSQFLLWNRGKRSVGINLRDEEGRALVRQLASEADVFIENYRPGVVEKMGLGYEHLRAENPRLIYCSVNAFGASGPYRDRPGTDPVVQAMSGVMSVTGEVGGEPLLVGVPTADFAGAMTAFQGVLLALLARERTGVGQKVEVSMLAALINGLATRLASFWASDEDPQRQGGAHSSVCPYQVFKSSDGYFVAGAWEDKGWPKFCQAIDRGDLEDDPRFLNNKLRVAHRSELVDEIGPDFAKRTTSDWESKFQAADGLFGPVNTFSEVFAHPQVVAHNLVTEAEHPRAGTIRQLGPVIQMSDTPGSVGRTAPLLGQHSLEVLTEIGYASDALEKLVSDGVIS